MMITDKINLKMRKRPHYIFPGIFGGKRIGSGEVRSSLELCDSPDMTASIGGYADKCLAGGSAEWR